VSSEKIDFEKWAEAFPECVVRQAGEVFINPFELRTLDLGSRVDAEAFLVDVLRWMAGMPSEPRRTGLHHPVMYASQALLTVSRGRAGALLSALEGEQLLARLESCNRAAIQRVRRHLTARAASAPCPCASGRADDPRQEPDIDVEQREVLPPPDPENVGKHDIHYRCRCRACGARWLVVEAWDWERASFAWSLSDAP
jgi:hypothetical protein